MEYQEFLENKIQLAKFYGHDILESDINPMLKPHQKDIVRWAIKGGRRAIFAAFGLGKTFIQLEVLRLLQKKTGGMSLVIAPLGVRQEFRIDGKKLGIKVHYIKKTKDLKNKSTGIFITNYESVRDGKLDINLFNCVSLDEASVLRSYGSKTYQNFLTIFSNIAFRFVCTATPSPNRYKELIHYAGFLGIMDTGQALTRFFQRDSKKANNLTIYPHKEKEFWLWLASWAVFVNKPSNLGYSNEGYDLPKLKTFFHEVVNSNQSVDFEKDGQQKLFRHSAASLQDAAKEKRESLSSRISKMKEILKSNPGDSFILWHDLESERHAIKKVLPEAQEVYGSQDMGIREKRIIDFSFGKTKYLCTKPILSGSGCNFQRFCHKAIYLGIGFKFNDWIQSIHRIHRFLQEHQCEIHIIYTNNEHEILKILMAKWERHERMVEKMTALIEEHGLSNIKMHDALKRSIGIERIEVKGKNFVVANNDAVLECNGMKNNSIDLIHTSVPFGNHYEFTPSYNDFGHNENNDNFFKQMDFLTPELLRILRPGRVAAIHVKDRIQFGNVTGYGMPSVDPFHVICIQHYRQHGFIYFGMITVVTDVVRENNQTYRLGWSEQCKDGTKMGVGSPEYILLFRKLPTDTSKGYADIPVKKEKKDYTRAQWQVDAHAFWRSSGDRFLNSEELKKYPIDQISAIFKKHSLSTIYDYKHHIKIGKELDLIGCLPSTFMTLAPGSHHKDVWHDINRMRTFNSDQKRKNLTNHICPLQFDIVERIINRYSSEGETVFDPFGGLMTVPYIALKSKRKAIASELSSEYFFDGVKYLEAIEHKLSLPTLFDIEEINKNEKTLKNA